jgi:hypothetical protein
MSTKQLSRLFLPIAIESIVSAKRTCYDRLVEQLTDVGFMTRKIEHKPGSVNIEIQVLDKDAACELIAGEAIKFFLASRLSFFRSAQEQPKNAAWQAVEHYYAAYYAVHFLLRVTGTLLSNLDKSTMDAIGKNLLSGQPAANIPSGLYSLTYEESGCTLSLVKVLRRFGGGSHQDAWMLWSQLVAKMQANSQKDPREYSAVALDLIEHKRFLELSTGRFRPPELRGEINYQFKGGTWEFESSAIDSIRKAQLAIRQERHGTISCAHSWEGLVSNNLLIIELSRTIFCHFAASYSRSIFRSVANKYKTLIASSPENFNA